ncbi:MAG: hypothetical protein LBI08_03295, partial [Methanomassiliicoccaceae archaeon]|nr:hypothetical protein [Methanomassiliicoccaceae archaeon]
AILDAEGIVTVPGAIHQIFGAVTEEWDGTDLIRNIYGLGMYKEAECTIVFEHGTDITMTITPGTPAVVIFDGTAVLTMEGTVNPIGVGCILTDGSSITINGITFEADGDVIFTLTTASGSCDLGSVAVGGSGTLKVTAGGVTEEFVDGEIWYASTDL